METWSSIVTAGATTAMAAITGVLALVAWLQVKSARDEAKRSRTLAACERYDLDPFLDQSLRRLREAHNSGDFLKDPEPYKHDVLTLLNYFESIAIGVKRNLYDIKIVRDHFAEIFQDHFNEYLGPNAVTAGWFTRNEFDRYQELCRNWAQGTASLLKTK